MESKVDFQRRREVKRPGDKERDQRCSASKGSDSFSRSFLLSFDRSQRPKRRFKRPSENGRSFAARRKLHGKDIRNTHIRSLLRNLFEWTNS